MSDKIQAIKDEIFRLKHNTPNAYDLSRFMLLEEIEHFIDSLPEPASEDLEEAASKYVREDFHERSRADFKAGAEWADQRPRKGLWDAEKVCEWVKENAWLYDIVQVNCVKTDIDDIIHDLRKAMED